MALFLRLRPSPSQPLDLPAKVTLDARLRSRSDVAASWRGPLDNAIEAYIEGARHVRDHQGPLDRLPQRMGLTYQQPYIAMPGHNGLLGDQYAGVPIVRDDNIVITPNHVAAQAFYTRIQLPEGGIRDGLGLDERIVPLQMHPEWQRLAAERRRQQEVITENFARITGQLMANALEYCRDRAILFGEQPNLAEMRQRLAEFVRDAARREQQARDVAPRTYEVTIAGQRFQIAVDPNRPRAAPYVFSREAIIDFRTREDYPAQPAVPDNEPQRITVMHEWGFGLRADQRGGGIGVDVPLPAT